MEKIALSVSNREINYWFHPFDCSLFVLLFTNHVEYYFFAQVSVAESLGHPFARIRLLVVSRIN